MSAEPAPGMSIGRAPARTSVLARLIREPRRFGFDAAVRIFMRAHRRDEPADAVRFRTPPGLTFPPADVLEIRRGGSGTGEKARPDVVVGLMGLTGPSGVLPRYYSEIVSQTLRGGSAALHQFLDMLGERFVGFFAEAGIKYRPARAADTALLKTPPAPDAVAQVLLSLTGYGLPHLAPRLAAGTEPLLHYAGLFALRPRSADRLAALLSDWLGMRVEVTEYAGAWLRLPPSQRTRIGARGVFHRLGVDAAVGVRAWSPEARILIGVGPLSWQGFQLLLPDTSTLQRVVSLVRAFIGVETGFVINPVLTAEQVPPLRLDATAAVAPRLGWNTWLPIGAGSGKRRGDAADAVFDSDVIEAWAHKQSAMGHVAKGHKE